MEKIKTSKTELLRIVKENRTKHKEEYLDAIKAYRVKAADLLSKELEKIVNGEKFETYFGLVKPVSHEKEYDLTIKMLEMSIEDVVEITQYEFNQMVNDQWDWKSTFQSSYLSNHSYIGLHQIGPQGSEGSQGVQGITFAADEN